MVKEMLTQIDSQMHHASSAAKTGYDKNSGFGWDWILAAGMVPVNAEGNPAGNYREIANSGRVYSAIFLIKG